MFIKEPKCPVCDSKNCEFEEEYDAGDGFHQDFFCDECCSTFSYIYEIDYVQTKRGFVKTYKPGYGKVWDDNSKNPNYHPELQQGIWTT